MANSNDNASTLKSYVDSASDTAQYILGSLTSNSAHQKHGEAKREKAQAEYDASHATAKLPGFTATAHDVSQNDPERVGGSWNQTIGSTKEAVGGLLGSEVRSLLS